MNQKNKLLIAALVSVSSACGTPSSSSLMETSRTPRNAGFEYTYRVDQDLIDALALRRTSFVNQSILLPEVNDLSEKSRPEVQLSAFDTNLYRLDFGRDGLAYPKIPAGQGGSLKIYTNGTGGVASADGKIGQASLTLRFTVSTKENSMKELPGKRLLTAKANFTVRTGPSRRLDSSIAYVNVLCGGQKMNPNDSQIFFKADDVDHFATPQVQISNFDYANCKEQVDLYFVVSAQAIEFRDASFLVTTPVEETEEPALLLDPNMNFCQFKHKEDTLGGLKGQVNSQNASGKSKSCDVSGDWKTICKDGNSKTDEVGCSALSGPVPGLCQYKHKKDTAGGQSGTVNALDAFGKQKSCDKTGDWKTACKDGNGDTDEVACK